MEQWIHGNNFYGSLDNTSYAMMNYRKKSSSVSIASMSSMTSLSQYATEGNSVAALLSANSDPNQIDKVIINMYLVICILLKFIDFFLDL